MFARKDGSDILQITHACHIEPALRNCDHDIGAAETKRFHDFRALKSFPARLTNEIFTGDPDMDAAEVELLRDLRSGQKGDFGSINAFNFAAVSALVSRLLNRQPR